MRRDRNSFFWACCLGFIAACASTQITASKKTPDYRPRAFTRVAVFAITDDPGRRNLFEGFMKKALEERGMVTETGAALVPENPQKIPREEIKKRLQAAGIDGVLTVRLLAVDTETVRERSTPRVVVDPAFGPFYNYYAIGFHEVYSQPYVRESKIVRLESRFFDLDSASTLAWRGESETVDPASAHHLAESFAQAVAARLFRENLLKPAGGR